MADKFISKDNFFQKQPPIEAKMKVLDHIYPKRVSIFTRITQYSKIGASVFALLFIVMLASYFNNANKEQDYMNQLTSKIDNTQIVVKELIAIADEEDKIEF